LTDHSGGKAPLLDIKSNSSIELHNGVTATAHGDGKLVVDAKGRTVSVLLPDGSASFSAVLAGQHHRSRPSPFSTAQSPSLPGFFSQTPASSRLACTAAGKACARPLFTQRRGSMEFSELRLQDPVYPRSYIGPETPDSPGPVPVADPYMLWWCIKMQEDE
jgi:hypothetical protein